MPKFSHISRLRLQTCHPDLQRIFEQVIRHYDCSVLCGHRGQEDQDKAYAEGNSKLRWPNSKHNTNPSQAVDVAPWENGSLDWNKLQCAFFAGYVMGIAQDMLDAEEITHKIRCGIDWNMNNDVNDTVFWDATHFEIVPNKTDP